MGDNPLTTSAARFDVEPSVSNHFAWIRTQLGLQRTYMAGVRTAVSLIGFGFTVAQFFQRLMEAGEGAGRMGPESPRNLGLVLIASGVIALAIFTYQYHRGSAYLRHAAFAAISVKLRRPLHASSYLIATAVMIVGVAAFLSVLARF
jgi:putative membrane protein